MSRWAFPIAWIFFKLLRICRKMWMQSFWFPIVFLFTVWANSSPPGRYSYKIYKGCVVESEEGRLEFVAISKVSLAYWHNPSRFFGIVDIYEYSWMKSLLWFSPMKDLWIYSFLLKDDFDLWCFIFFDFRCNSNPNFFFLSAL